MAAISQFADTDEAVAVRSSHWFPFGTQLTLIEPSEVRRRCWRILISNEPGIGEAEVETDVSHFVQFIVTRLVSSSGNVYLYQAVPVEKIDSEIQKLEGDIVATLRSLLVRAG